MFKHQKQFCSPRTAGTTTRRPGPYETSQRSTLRLGVDYTYTGRMFNDVQNTPLLVRPDVRALDGWVSFVSPSGKATLTIDGTNLTDKRYITTGEPRMAGGVVFGTYNPPPEWYAILGLRL